MGTVDADPILHPDEEILDDNDSSLGDDVASSTQSISSSILNYRHENGRTYHRYKDGKYHLPNDEAENERLDLQHHLFLLTFSDKLGLSPPNSSDSNAKRVLDLGTGTGIWAIDYADEHPQAEVIGIDLSPIQPDFVPPNVRFIIDDIDEEWNYGEEFDYVHSRMMMFSIKDWDKYIRKIFKSLAPGGYIEIQETDGMISSDDGTLKEDHALAKWCKLLGEAFTKLGSTSIEFDRIKATMAEVGFTDIVDTRFKWPVNPWPKNKKYKELGTWNNYNGSRAIDSLTMGSFTRAHGWTRDEVTMFLVDVRKDTNNPRIHAYNLICSIHARKPSA
ncbi:hypothetical protein FSARC_12628 [Fusarium sarcochroum]|uniref:Methyltransferase n=1 Tax=Fusarium sarcochroum TaxID=1208366 RepID=A0A8H4T726_9HYPO|nr:hypothetical protein FSARC_12628 [Fusarium sarcochroum]